MLLNGFRHLPVVEGRKVLGVVSLRELFAARNPPPFGGLTGSRPRDDSRPAAGRAVRVHHARPRRPSADILVAETERELVAEVQAADRRGRAAARARRRQ